MKAIVLMFTKKTGRPGSETYLCHNIEKIKVTIEGNPNMVYSQKINKNTFYSEAKGVFIKVQDYVRLISIQSFYNYLFALVIDLRSIVDNMKHETCKKSANTQLGFSWK